MNDDPGPSSAARQPPPRSDGEYPDDVDEHSVRTEESRDDGCTNESPASRQREKRREGLVKKLEHITQLQKSLDLIVSIYICVLYFME